MRSVSFNYALCFVGIIAINSTQIPSQFNSRSFVLSPVLFPGVCLLHKRNIETKKKRLDHYENNNQVNS